MFDGLAIATAIRTHKGKTTAYVDGLAASAASYIAISADEVVMALGSELMIHDAWGFAAGNAEDMTKMAADLEHVSANIAGLYAAKAGGTAADWRPAMIAETWYSADEAVTAGLADRVDKGKKVDEGARNAFDLSIFAHAGRAHAPAPLKPPAEPAENTTPQPEGADMASDRFLSGLRERLGVNAELDEDGLLAALDEALSEQAESTRSVSASIPDGTTLIDQSALAELQASAALGRAAHEQQTADRRARIVDEAVTDGRIPPARRDHWLAQLKADEEGIAPVLASLPKGTIPLAEAGYTGGVDEASDDDLIFDKLFSKEA